MKLTVRIWRDDEGLYRAVVESLPGCSAKARTQEEVLRQIDAAAKGYVASFHAVSTVELKRELVEV